MKVFPWYHRFIVHLNNFLLCSCGPEICARVRGILCMLLFVPVFQKHLRHVPIHMKSIQKELWDSQEPCWSEKWNEANIEALSRCRGFYLCRKVPGTYMCRYTCACTVYVFAYCVASYRCSCVHVLACLCASRDGDGGEGRGGPNRIVGAEPCQHSQRLDD